jgi:hypothetical protein
LLGSFLTNGMTGSGTTGQMMVNHLGDATVDFGGSTDSFGNYNEKSFEEAS